jgi:hypothetical protein
MPVCRNRSNRTTGELLVARLAGEDEQTIAPGRRKYDWSPHRSILLASRRSRRTSCVPNMPCDEPRARLHRVAWHLDDRVAQVDIDLANSLPERFCRLEGHLSVAVGDIDLRPGRQDKHDVVVSVAPRGSQGRGGVEREDFCVADHVGVPGRGETAGGGAPAPTGLPRQAVTSK